VTWIILINIFRDPRWFLKDQYVRNSLAISNSTKGSHKQSKVSPSMAPRKCRAHNWNLFSLHCNLVRLCPGPQIQIQYIHINRYSFRYRTSTTLKVSSCVRWAGINRRPEALTKAKVTVTVRYIYRYRYRFRFRFRATVAVGDGVWFRVWVIRFTWRNRRWQVWKLA